MPEIRGAIGVHHTATSDVAWDAAEMLKRCKSSETELRMLHAWRSSDGDVNAKGSYKFPHHIVSGDGQVHAANVKACQSIIGVLNGARGGADIPDSDIQGVYKHASAHLKDAGLEPPELKRSGEQPEVERRAVAEFRMVREAEKPPRLEGRAIPYNSETTINSMFGDFREVFRPGACTRAIRDGQDVVCWYQHGQGAPLPLGRTKSGTLRLMETPDGVDFSCDMPDTQDARDLGVSIDRGDITQMSFAFMPFPGTGDRWTPGTPMLREVVDTDLMDISPVVFGAYKETSVAVRGAELSYQRYLDSQQGAGSPSEADAVDPKAGLEVERARIELERQR